MLGEFWRKCWANSNVASYAITRLLMPYRDLYWKLLVPHASLLSRLGLGHEPKVEAALRTVKGDLFVDVGAGYGWYIHLFRKKFRHIVAIEPDLETATWLKSHAPRNCKVLAVAISERNGIATLGKVNLSENPIKPWSSLAITQQASMEGRLVPVRSLSSLFTPQTEIDLVKVDVEGTELLVLRGASKIMSTVKAWLVEVHHPNHRTKKAEITSYMRKEGYWVEWLDDYHAYFCR